MPFGHCSPTRRPMMLGRYAGGSASNRSRGIGQHAAPRCARSIQCTFLAITGSRRSSRPPRSAMILLRSKSSCPCCPSRMNNSQPSPITPGHPNRTSALPRHFAEPECHRPRGRVNSSKARAFSIRLNRNGTLSLCLVNAEAGRVRLARGFPVPSRTRLSAIGQNFLRTSARMPKLSSTSGFSMI